MLRFSTVLVAALAVVASAAMAQTSPTVRSQPQIERQQATAPVRDVRDARSPHGFIVDEFGNVYDAKGQPIKPRPIKR